MDNNRQAERQIQTYPHTDI